MSSETNSAQSPVPGWYVSDGIRDLDGPFATKGDADKVVRRIKRERSGEEYHPNGWTLPIWVPRASYRAGVLKR